MARIACSILAAVVLGGCGAPAPSPETKENNIGKKADKVIVPFWWSGDRSSCMTAAHDRTFWPQYWDDGSEFGAESGSAWNGGGAAYGHPGCSGYIIDYQIPYDMVGAPWNAAWIAASPRFDTSTQWKCENTWVNLIIYGYTHHGAGPDGGVIEVRSEFLTWGGPDWCYLDVPPNTWFNQEQHMIRVVSQAGQWIAPGGNHYSYFVTN